MKIEPKNLSSDPKTLHEIVNVLSAENTSLKDRNQTLKARCQILKDRNQALIDAIQSLKEQLILLRKKNFGQSSEKLTSQIENIEFRLEENELLDENVLDENEIFATSEVTPDELDQSGDIDKVEAKDKSNNDEPRKKAKRKKLPEHLPRDTVVIPAPTICSSCGGEEFRKIADDVSEILEYVPSSFKVIRFVRPRCACVNCDQISQGYAQSKPIDKGKAGAGLLAHILTQKYCDHLPMYRQSQIYAREGIDLSRSTLASWAGQCARLLEPLVEELRKSIFSSSEIHGDDTPIKVLAPGTGKTKIGRIWTYVRDGRPHGDKTPPAVCYFYSPDRTGERPKEHLKDFTGTLHADAYAGYDKLYLGDKKTKAKITEAGCWAHTRRKFYEITVANDKANIAFEVLDSIGEVYKIEERINGFAPDERLKVRQNESSKFVEKLFVTFNKYYSQLPKKSSTAKAIAYALNHQIALKRFLEDGRIEIDNNAGERAMRLIAVGRKNWLFAGSDNGGHTAANIYSLIETTKLNNINPWKYLRHVLSVIQDYNSTKLVELLPWNIKLE